MSNDSQQPLEARRNYKSVFDCGVRIAREEGVATFWRGSAPFVNRAMLVGVTQVGSLDQFKDMYDKYLGIKRGTVRAHLARFLVPLAGSVLMVSLLRGVKTGRD